MNLHEQTDRIKQMMGLLNESTDTEYSVIEITMPMAYMPKKYYYQAVPTWKTKEDTIYVLKGKTGKTISTENIKVLKTFKGGHQNPEMLNYLEELRKKD